MWGLLGSGAECRGLLPIECQEEAGTVPETSGRGCDAATEEVLSGGRAERVEESGQGGVGCAAVGVNMEPEMEEALRREGEGRAGEGRGERREVTYSILLA